MYILNIGWKSGRVSTCEICSQSKGWSDCLHQCCAGVGLVICIFSSVLKTMTENKLCLSVCPRHSSTRVCHMVDIGTDGNKYFDVVLKARPFIYKVTRNQVEVDGSQKVLWWRDDGEGNALVPWCVRKMEDGGGMHSLYSGR